MLLLRECVIYSSMIGISYLVGILNVSVDVIGDLVLSVSFEFPHLGKGSIHYQAFERIIKIDSIIET